MEIAKFRLQLSTALGRVRRHLWQLRFRFRKLTRIAAEKARISGHEFRTRANALRVWLVAKSREAIVAANSTITKSKARLSIAAVKGTEHLRQARNSLTRLKRSTAEKLRTLAEERRTRAGERRRRKDELRAQAAAKSRAAAIEVDRKITTEVDRKPTKVKAQPLIAPGQWTAHLLDGQNPLAGLARSMAEDGAAGWSRQLAASQPSGAQQVPRELRAREEGLRVPEAKPQETIATPAAPRLLPPRAERKKITKVRAQVFAPFERGTARLRLARKTLAGVGRNIVDKRRNRRQELGTRESQMRELLASSPDAIAVINGDHCFVTANRKALDLFGISERNLSEFNIDAFLFRGQIRDLRQNGSFFMGRQERHGKCLIRRLDGSLQVAEFAFVTDFLPLQHLCRFYDLCMPRPTPVQHRIPPGSQPSSHAGQAQ